MKKFCFTLCMVSTMCFCNSNLSAKNIYVRPDGSPASDCGTGPAQICSSVATAVSNADSGDVIKITEGTFSEILRPLDNDNIVPQTLSIEGGWNYNFSSQTCRGGTVISPQIASSAGALIYIFAGLWRQKDLNLSCITLRGEKNVSTRKGIEVKASSSTINLKLDQVIIQSFSGNGLYIYNSDGIVEIVAQKTIFTRNGTPDGMVAWSGAAVSAYSLNAALSITLSDTEIKDNKIIGDGVVGAGVYISSDTSDTTLSVTNTIIANNHADRLSGLNVTSQGLSGTTNISLTNSTISGNLVDELGGAGLSIAAFGGSNIKASLVNTIVSGNKNTDPSAIPREIRIAEFDSATAIMNASHSILGEILEQIQSAGSGFNDQGNNIFDEPLLDPRYRLRRASPAIDAGICGFFFWNLVLQKYVYTRIAPYHDIDGEKRPGWYGCDIGADEYYDGSVCFPIKNPEGTISIICM